MWELRDCQLARSPFHRIEQTEGLYFHRVLIIHTPYGQMPVLWRSNAEQSISGRTGVEMPNLFARA